MANTKHIGCSYLETALHPETWNLLVKNLVKLIEQTKTKFDTIAFRGASGSLVAPAIAGTMGKEMFLVRKEQSTYSTYTFEGNRDIKDYIIVDDLIDSGRTIQEIINKVRGHSASATCKGIFLYEGHRKDSTQPCFEGPNKVNIPVNGIRIGYTDLPNTFSIFMNGETTKVSGFSTPNPTFFRRVMNFICA